MRKPLLVAGLRSRRLGPVINSPPAIDLNGGTAGVDIEHGFVEGGAAVRLCELATVSDPENNSLVSMRVVFSGLTPDLEYLRIGDPFVDVFLSTNSTYVIQSRGDIYSGTFTVSNSTLEITSTSGSAPASEWEFLLRSIAFVDLSVPATEGTRTLTISVTDSSLRSNEAEVSVLVSQEPGGVFRSLSFIGRSSANLLSAQGVATDGTYFWTTAGPTTNDELSKWTRSGNVYTLDSGPITNPLDVHTEWPAGQTQINHISYHDPGDGGGPRLWVGGNNYSITPRVGYVQEYDPDTLEYIKSHSTTANWSEGGAWRPGTNEFWVCFDNKAGSDWLVSRYLLASGNLSFDADVSLDGVTYESGTHYHNGLCWVDATTLLATVHEGTRPLCVEVYEYNDNIDTLTLVQRMRAPTMQCSQGICRSPLDSSRYFFAERFYPDGVTADHRIVEAELRSVRAVSGVPSIANTFSDQYTGLLAWYPLTEGTGTTATELITGAARNGTFSGGAWATDLAMGDSYVLDGSSQIDLSSAVHGTGLSTAMVMFWCKPSSIVDGAILVSGNASGSNAGDWQIKVDASGDRGIDFFYNNATTLSTHTSSRNGELQAGEWAHVAVTLDGTGAKVYINGVLKASNATTGAIGATGRALRLGASLINTDYFSGAIRDFRVYNAVDTNIILAACDPPTMFELWEEWRQPILALSGDENNVNVQETWDTGDGAKDMIPSVTISDVDNDDVFSIYIDVSGVLNGNSEELGIGGTLISLGQNFSGTDSSTPTTIAVVYNQSTGRVLFTKSGGGKIPHADVVSFLSSLTYENTAVTRSGGTRLFDFVVDDGQTTSNVSTLSVAVTASANIAPVLDLNGVLTGSNISLSFQEGGSAVPLCSSALITDADDTDLLSASIVGTGITADTEVIKIGSPQVDFALGSNLTTTAVGGGTTFSVAYTTSNKTFAITKSGGGVAPIADWQALLQSLSYVNNSVTVTPGNRVFTCTVSDSDDPSNSCTITVDVQSVANNAPIVDLNGASSGTDVSVSYATGAGVVSLCSSANLTDADGDPLVSMTISMSNVSADAQTLRLGTGPTIFNLASASSSTAVAGATTFSVAYVTSPSKVMTITKSGGGSAPIADWQTLLRSLQYQNTAGTITAGYTPLTVVVNDGADNSNSAIIGINTSSVIIIDNAWLTANGPAPYYLRTPAKTYRLETDVTVEGTAFMVLDTDITLDLNGHTVTYANSAPITVPNGGFESGSGPTDIPNWTLSDPTKATRIAARTGMWGSYMLRLASISVAQTVTSEEIAIPKAGVEYAAGVFCRGSSGSTVVIRIMDSATSAILASGSSANVNRGFGAIARFTPSTTAPIKISILVTPASGQTQTVDLDYVSFERSRDYGIVCARSYWYLPTHLRSTIVDNESNLCVRFTLKNGNVTQGTGKSVEGNAMFASNCSGLTVTDVVLTCNGMDTSIVFGQYASNTVFLRNSFIGELDRISNRMLQFGALWLSNAGGTVQVSENTVSGEMHAGIVVTRQAENPSAISITDNTITHTALGTDGYGIIINFCKNFTIDGNIIQPVNARGILFDGYGNGKTTDGVLSNNIIEAREWPNLEYDGLSMEATGLRIRCYGSSTFRNLLISGNTMFAETEIDADWAAIGSRITVQNGNGNSTNSNIVFEGNTFKAILNSIDPDYTGAKSPRAWGVSISGVTPGTGLVFRNNNFESNDRSLNLGDNDSYDSTSGDIDFYDSTFTKSAEGIGGLTHYSIVAGDSLNTITDVRFFNNQFASGATPTILWRETRNKDISIGWELDVTVTDGGSPVSGATVNVEDISNTVVYNGTTDGSGQLLNVPVVTTIYRQTTTNPAVITTDTRTPLDVIATSGVKTGVQTVTPTANSNVSVAIV